MATPLAALVLDGDMRAALVAIRSLARAGRPVGVLEAYRVSPSIGFASRYPSLRVVAPDHTTGVEKYVSALLDVLDRRPADVVLPVDDGTVAVLRKHRDQLASRTALALAAEPALEVAVDKRLTLATAEALGLPIPRGFIVTSEDQLSAVAAEVRFPCVVKPSVSWSPESAHVGRLRCRAAVDHADLGTAVREVLAGGASAVVQQWLSGRKEAVHLLYADGRFWAEVCVIAHRTLPALGGNSVLRTTVPMIPDTVAAAERLIRHIDLEGYAEVEFRRDLEGRPVLMEINPRLSASVEAATRAGVDFPVLVHDWARRSRLRPVEGYRAGVRLRWLGGDLRWLRESWTSSGRPDVPYFSRALAMVLASSAKPAAYDLLDFGDPKPAARAVNNLVQRHDRRRNSEKRNPLP